MKEVKNTTTAPKKAQAELNLDVISLESLKTTNVSSQELKDLFFKRNFRTVVHWLTSKVQLRLAKAFNILHRSRLKIKRHSIFLFLL